MDIKELQTHLDKRLDRVEEKLDQVTPAVAVHTAQIAWLRGYAKIGLTILISAAGFFAVAFFHK